MKKSMPLALTALMLPLLTVSALAASGTVLRNEKLYAKPSATAAATGSVAKGANVEVLSRQGGWLRVSAGRTTGWIRLLSVRVGGGGSGGAGLGDVVGVATTRSDPSRVVAVAGLRGLNDEDLKQAHFNAEELQRLDALAVSAAQASHFATEGGLAAVSVPALPRPGAAGNASSSSSSWGEK